MSRLIGTALILCLLAACAAPVSPAAEAPAVSSSAAEAAATTAETAAAAEEPSDIRLLGSMAKAQDGAVFGDWFFRFTAGGICSVYRTSEAAADAWKVLKPVGSFLLDRADEILPHSNSVCFGPAYCAPGDEFPLLYSNIYNSYEKEADKQFGTCCVYRLTRDGETFSSELVQIIRIGFADKAALWNDGGVAYGNFAVDAENSRLIAFLMRKTGPATRYFSFALPQVTDGDPHPTLGVRCVTLEETDILSYFDGPYSHFIQGACVHDGKLYSVEGRGVRFGEAGLRVIDLEAGEELYYLDFAERGMPSEPELIEFIGDGALYADYAGMLYLLDIPRIEAELLPAE